MAFCSLRNGFVTFYCFKYLEKTGGGNFSMSFFFSFSFSFHIDGDTGWKAKIVVLKETTLQLYLKTFIEKINSGNLIM